MKVFLLFKDRDFLEQGTLPPNADDLVRDLELDTLIKAMSGDDKALREAVAPVLLRSLTDPAQILYRQAVLQDCLNQSAVIREIHGLGVEAMEANRKFYRGLSLRYPSGILWQSVEALQVFTEILKRLKKVASRQAPAFKSEGFRAFFAMLEKELDDEYFSVIQRRLKELKFTRGMLISAELGTGNKGTQYILRKPLTPTRGWFRRLFAKRNPAFTIQIHPGDENGAKALGELRDRGINLVANALAQSNDHIISFFSMLRLELAFYIGCLNLHGQLVQKGAPLVFPTPMETTSHGLSFKGVYDAALTLTLNRRISGNDLSADGTDLIIITGANNGGKSTFLRSLGVAQLLMQCGMFVPAMAFCASPCSGLFTHYKRKEDPLMRSGKLDEEMSRMSEIVDSLKQNSMVLFNESFSSTNEREGSEIARLITSALLERKIRIVFITHFFDFAHGLFAKGMATALFLRAEREAEGVRTFKLIQGQPLQTSFGADLYQEVFCNPPTLGGISPSPLGVRTPS